MAEVAERVQIRRFELADLSQHGGWIMERLLRQYPHQTERTLAGWLRGILSLNTSLFLYQPHAVALAEVVRFHTLSAEPVVVERFVFCQKGHEAEAAEFYDEFRTWARHLDAKTLLVEELSDVPHELVTARVGRIFTRQQKFAKA